MWVDKQRSDDRSYFEQRAETELELAQKATQRPDGSQFPFIPYPIPIFDDAGTLVGAVDILLDISDRKKYEQAAQYLAAIVASSDAVIASSILRRRACTRTARLSTCR